MEKMVNTTITAIANSLLSKYATTMQNGVEWIKREGSIEESHIQYIYTEDKQQKQIAAAEVVLGFSP